MIVRLRLMAVAVGVLLPLAGATVARAHDLHTFGPFTVALGWFHEPAYVDADNAVQVIVKDQSGAPPATTTDRDLTVDVRIGTRSTGPQPMIPSSDPDTGLGTPGEYLFHFTPTVPGIYVFHVHGTVGSGVAVDETVSAGDRTFDEVRTATDAQFPTRVPALSDVATKVDAIQARAAAAQAAAQRAQDAADVDRRIAAVAIVLSVLAILAVIIGRRPRIPGRSEHG